MGSRVSGFKNFPGLVVASALVAAMSVGAGGVHAAPIPEGRLNNSAAEEVTGNTGATSVKQSITLPYDAGKFSDKPAETKITRMPAHLGFRGLADSKEYKKMFREMVSSEVPTLFQTMMMVENGAANGYLGAIQSVSSLLGNTVQSADLELKMRHIADPSGASERDYVNAIHDGLKNNQNGKYLWPMGIFYASGDRLDKEGLKEEHKLNSPFIPHPRGGASLVQHLPQEQRPGNGANADATEWKLSEVIFKDGANDQRTQKIKAFFTEAIGDIKFEDPSQNKDDPAVQIKATYVKPTKKETVKKGGGTGAASLSSAADGSMTTMSNVSTMAAGNDDFPVPDEVYGVNVLREEIRKKTWEDMYKLLGLYCEFKKENGNKGLKLFNKKFASEWIDMAGGNLMEDVSSNNLKVSLNVVDQIFKLWVQTTTDANQPTKINCNFENAEAEMPEDSEANEGGDSCEGADKAKKCRRNKWLYRFVDIIALDKLIDKSRDAYEKAMQTALTVDASTAQYVNQLFCNSFLANTSSESNQNQCNIGFYFDSISGANRQSWSDQLEAAAKLAQSLGGSSNFRFQPNNSLSAAGGSYDSAGDADPGAGGGSGS